MLMRSSLMPFTMATFTAAFLVFNGLSLADSMMIKGEFLIEIAPKQVAITKIDPEDSSKNEVYLKRRTMSALRYSTLDGNSYTEWKLGDRKMVLRSQNGCRYISVYKTDAYGLPEEYITFIITE